MTGLYVAIAFVVLFPLCIWFIVRIVKGIF